MVSLRGSKGAGHTLEARFETLRRAGYRNGVSATYLIGARLARVYEVAAGMPGDMGAVLNNLDGKAGDGR